MLGFAAFGFMIGLAFAVDRMSTYLKEIRDELRSIRAMIYQQTRKRDDDYF